MDTRTGLLTPSQIYIPAESWPHLFKLIDLGFNPRRMVDAYPKRRGRPRRKPMPKGKRGAPNRSPVPLELFDGLVQGLRDLGEESDRAAIRLILGRWKQYCPEDYGTLLDGLQRACKGRSATREGLVDSLQQRLSRWRQHALQK